MSYKKKTLLLIAVATLLRCVVACSINLGNDEVYYRMYAHYLQWNYFDHPPMVGWLIRLSTFNLLADNEFFIRSGAIVSAALTTWLFFLCGKKLMNGHAGFLAASIYTASIYGSIIAGTFILPDSPQMVCWSAGLYCLISFSQISAVNRNGKKKLLLFAVAAGLGMLCKIHTSFLWLGLLLYIIFYKREWLKQPVLYIAGIITLLFFYPVIKWNIDNHFVTYLYHSKRVDVSGEAFNFTSFFTFTGGQVLYCNPVIFIMLTAALYAAFKNKIPISISQKRVLLLCSLPLIITAAVVSLFKNVLPHWTGPAYSGMILLAACFFAGKIESTDQKKRRIPKLLLIANGVLLFIIAGGILLINFFPGTLGKKDNILLGDGDFTLDMVGWNNLKTDFEQLVKNDLQSGIMKKNAVIISYKWFPAAHLDYYVAMPMKMELIATGDISDIHQYAWINNERKEMQAGDDAYCIVPSNEYKEVKNTGHAFFTSILPAYTITQYRNGTPCRLFYVYRFKNFKLHK